MMHGEVGYHWMFGGAMWLLWIVLGVIILYVLRDFFDDSWISPGSGDKYESRKSDPDK